MQTGGAAGMVLPAGPHIALQPNQTKQGEEKIATKLGRKLKEKFVHKLIPETTRENYQDLTTTLSAPR
jgi:hypothetical protein